MDDLVSIVIPTHNRADMLQRALDSALAQTHPHLEIIVVDDGSKDNTAEVVQAYQEKHPNVKYLKNETALGACPTRNRGIMAATGKYTSFLDDDDEYLPERIAEMLQLYHGKADWAFVTTDYLSITKKGTRRSHKPGPIPLEKILWINYAGQTVMAETKKLQALGGFDEDLTAAQDYDMWTRLIRKYGTAFRSSKVLYLYHQEHDKPRITSTFSKKMKGYYDYYLKHKPVMSRSQRAYQLYRLLKFRGRKIKLQQFLTMVPFRFYLLEFNDILIYKTNFYRYFNSFKKALGI